LTKKRLIDQIRSRKPATLRMVGTFVALVLLGYLLSQQGWEEILAAIQRIPLWRFVLALGLMLISRLAVAARWHILLRAVEPDFPFRHSLRITFAGLFASNFLPTTIGGDVVRLAGAIQLQLEAAVAAASLVVDRLVGMTGMAMALPLCLPSLVGGKAILPPESSLQITLAALPSSRWWRKTRELLSRAAAKLYKALILWLKQPASLGFSLGFSWINMLCLFIILEILLGGIGEYMPLWLIGGLYSLVYFVTLIPISVNGYGLQEISMTIIFSNLGNATVSNGLTVALLFRTLMLLASLPGVLFLPDILSASKTSDQASGADQPGGAP